MRIMIEKSGVLTNIKATIVSSVSGAAFLLEPYQDTEEAVLASRLIVAAVNGFRFLLYDLLENALHPVAGREHLARRRRKKLHDPRRREEVSDGHRRCLPEGRLEGVEVLVLILAPAAHGLPHKGVID
jgi:hypothetical protein